MSSLERHNATRLGSGRPLLFAHGDGCDQTVRRAVATALAARRDAVRGDLAECGDADPSLDDRDRRATLGGHADDLVRIVEAAQLDRRVRVAHAVVTMIAVRAARRRPDLFDSPVPIAPSRSDLNDGDDSGRSERDDIDSLLDTREPNPSERARTMAPVVMGNADRPELADGAGDSFCRMASAAARHCARVTVLSDHRVDIEELPLPVLLLPCSDDALAAPRVGGWLARRMAASTLAQRAAMGHCPHASAPGEVLAALDAHLRRRH